MTILESAPDEVPSLRRTLRDLVAMSSLPAVWAGQEPQEMMEGLAEALLASVRPDLVYLHLPGLPNGVSFDTAYMSGRRTSAEEARKIGQALAPHLASPTGRAPISLPHPAGPGTIQIVVIPTGHPGQSGAIVAGSQRPDFPTATEHDLLSVAGNQAVIWSHEARLVAELKQREEALRLGKQELDDFFENAAVAMHWLGPDGIILRANQAELDLLGYAREEYVGHPIAEFQDDPAGTDDMLNRLLRGETILDHEGRLRCKDGSIKDVLVSCNAKWNPANGHFVHSRCFTRDITARKLAEAERQTRDEQLRASEERFRALANAMPAIAWTADPDGTITYASDKWFEYCGVAPEQNARGWPELVLHPDDYERCVTRWTQALQQGTEYEIEVRNRRHDGEFRWFLTRAVPLYDAQGRVTAWYGTSTDIHDQKRLEMQLQAQAARLKVLAEASQAFAQSVPDYAALLDAVVRQVAESLGDLCTIRLLVNESTWLPTSAAYHPDPQAQVFLRELIAANPSVQDGWSADVIRTGQPLLFSAAAQEQLRARVPPYLLPYLHKYGFYSALIVPLKVSEHVIGVLAVARDHPGRSYTGEDQDLLLDLADRAALAIENARLYEREQRARSEAEQFNAELEQRVLMRTGELQALARRLQDIREEERTRLAREIHDELGGELTGLKMEIVRLRKAGGERDPELLERLSLMSGLVDQIIKTVRRIATDLRPAILDDFGLPAAIAWQLQEFEARSGIPSQLISRFEDLDLDPEQATAVFRIFQEALTNVARHAQATRVEAQLERHADCLVLQIQDNGRGIPSGELAGTKSLGIVGMRERVRLLSGELLIQGTPGQGTRVVVKIPLKP